MDTNTSLKKISNLKPLVPYHYSLVKAKTGYTFEIVILCGNIIPCDFFSLFKENLSKTSSCLFFENPDLNPMLNFEENESKIL